MKDQKLTYAEIIALTVVERYALMSDTMKLGKKVVETRDNYRAVTPASAKVVAALKRDHAKLKDDKIIAPDTSFAEFFAQNCGGKLPGRMETLATFFNSMCLVDDGGKPLLPEAFYDAASVNSLEIASKCLNHAKKLAQDAKTDWRGHNDTLDVINALSMPGDATKKLKEIRKRQNPEKSGTESGDENAVALTVETAMAFLLAAVKSSGKLPVDKAASLYEATVKFNDQLGDAWSESGSAMKRSTAGRPTSRTTWP